VENQSQIIDSSPLSKARIKILLPGCYTGSAKLEDFKDFIFNILRWLSEWQLMLLGTCLTSKAQELYMRNVELPMLEFISNFNPNLHYTLLYALK
jgi:hypothetical protein